MTFDPNVRLDPTQVTDVRGRSVGRGGGLAIGGGGLGLVIALIYILLGGNPGDLVSSGGGSGPDVNGPDSSALAQCQTGTQAQRARRLPDRRHVNSVQAFWATQVQGYRKAETVLFTRPDLDRLRRRDHRGRAVLLPRRHERLPRPRVLRRAPDTLRREGRPVRPGVRRRPRVRPPRPGPGRRPPAGRRTTRADGPVGADRAPGRLLRRRLGATTRRDRLPRAADPGPDRGCARRGRVRRRRPDPVRDPGPGRPGDVDPRLVRAAPALVQRRLPDRRPRPCDTFNASNL